MTRLPKPAVPKKKAHPRSSEDSPAKPRLRRPSSHGGYGGVRDLPDARDFGYEPPLSKFPKGLPKSVDLRSKCPPVYTQGKLESCTAQAIAAAIEFDRMKQGVPRFVPSRLFIYYNIRVIENTVAQNAGTHPRNGVKSVATHGAPAENVWPYDVARFAKKPPPIAYDKAKQDIVTSYYAVTRDIAQMRGCLADGYPFLLGFAAYESFEGPAVAASGILPMPASGERKAGDHVVLAVGYDDGKRSFIMRNSWGPRWGLKGYFWMPYEYLQDRHLAADFWTLRSVKGSKQGAKTSK
jgi:C1A family cysteine protease